MLQKVYKPLNINNNNILPGNLQGLPDDYFFSTLVFIDAGFLSKLSKYFGNAQSLFYDIIKFSENLSKKQKLNCKKIFYYTAPPFQSPTPTKEEENKKRSEIRMNNILITGVIIILLLALIPILSVYAQSGGGEGNETLQAELTNLISELNNAGYSWLINQTVNYSETDASIIGRGGFI